MKILSDGLESALQDISNEVRLFASKALGKLA